MEIKKNESDAAERVMLFPLLVDATDGLTVEAGEAGGQPEYSTDGGQNWGNTNGVLVGGTNGAYQVQLTQAETNQAYGTTILGRYKSAATAEARAIPIRIVAPDPFSATNMGLSALPTATPAAVGGLPTVDASNYIAGLQALGAAQAHADVEAEGLDAIESVDLDHLLKVAHPTGNPVADTIMDLVMNKDGGQTYARATDALEAIRDRGDAAWPTAAGFAVAGDAMDLINDAVDANSLAAAAANEIRDTILDDATRFSGADIDAAISGRATPAQVATALTDIDLDHLLKIAHPTGLPTADSIFDLVMNKDAGQNFARANESLEALRDRGDAAWGTAVGFAVAGDAMDLVNDALDAASLAASANAEIADAVLNEAMAGHVGAGTLGKLLNDYLDAAVSSRGTADPGDDMNLADGAITAAKIAAAAFIAAKFGADFLTNGGLATSAANEIRDAILDDATRFSGANVDAAVSTRSTLTAAQVWAHGARTLTSFGTLVADTATAVWAAGTRTLTSFGTLIADIWAYVTRTLTAGGDATAANQATIIADIATVIGTGGPGPWTSAGAGAGANNVEVTIDDGAGAPVLAMGVSIWNSDESSIVGGLTTDALGQCTFQLNNGTYQVLTLTTPSWEGSSNTLVVAGPMSVTYSLTARALPVPSAPDKYALYMNCADEEGAFVGAAAWTLYVTKMEPAGLGADDLVTLSEENPFESDASGRITWDVPKTTRRLSIRIVRTMADATTKEWTNSFIIDGSLAVADAIDVADLLTD